jgi:hypothetical protein
MNEFLWLFCGLLLGEMAHWMLRLHRQWEDERRRSDAKQVLKRHGLAPQLYLATIGEEIGEEDAELLWALDSFAFTGHIITNTKGEVAGKLCPTVVKGPHLRLVSSCD